MKVCCGRKEEEIEKLSFKKKSFNFFSSKDYVLPGEEKKKTNLQWKVNYNEKNMYNVLVSPAL